MLNTFFSRLSLILLFFPVPGLSIEYQYEEDPVDDGKIMALVDFDQEIKQAKLQQKPLMIEFSTAWCEFCETLEEMVLKPILANRDYDDKVIIRKLEVDSIRVVRVDGIKQSAEDFAMRHSVNLFPTLVFFNGEGKETSKRVIGIRTFEYVADEIDRSIDRARDLM